MHSGEFLSRHCRLAQVRRARTKFVEICLGAAEIRLTIAYGCTDRLTHSSPLFSYGRIRNGNVEKSRDLKSRVKV